MSMFRRRLMMQALAPKIEAPIPDCYYNLAIGSNDDVNREQIYDYSGNNNHATAHNFAWNEEGSGYKDGALYFDGVDDYISLDAFDSGLKTIFMLCTFFTYDMFLYDQRDNINDFENCLTTNGGSFCYYGRNYSGISYINGVFNPNEAGNIRTIHTNSKKHLITCTLTGENISIPIIANRYDKGYKFMKMNLFKFLGFKGTLTEEEIQYVIKKYNLLDGVDEIEVS